MLINLFKKLRISIAFIFSIFIIFSCNMNPINEILMRKDVFNDVVIITELNDIRAVRLNWQEDAAAENYIVMRSIFNENAHENFQPIYRGIEQTFTDRDLQISKTYAYRLDKTRGDSIFNGSDISYYTRPQPFAGVLTLQVINNGMSAYLTWEEDENADKYIIVKTEGSIDGYDFNHRFLTERFEFVGVQSYIDNKIEIDKSYAYRLDKLCGDVLFEGVAITFFNSIRPEPFYDTVNIQNLNNGRSAYITWKEDIGADDYRIMRAINDGSAVIFLERINGIDGFFMQGAASAIDSTLEDDKGYLYRLDKKRDGVWIPGREIVPFSRTRPMPFGDTPVVTSFREDGNIHIKWQYDDGADFYLLMRSFDNPLTSALDPFVVVYEGLELEYLDTNVNSQRNERYVYKLFKSRNNNIFRWDDRISLGVAVVTQEDRHEPNNIEANATLLETFRIANIYCFGYSISNTFLNDMDWYKVNIPPGKVANIAVEYNNAANSGFFLLYIPFLETESIIHNVAFQIRNDDSIQKDITFAIIPDRTRFLLSNGTGGSVAGYTITWVNISNN